jgi:hypothetical protein
MAAVMSRFQEGARLYGSFMGVHNPGEHQHIDGSRPGAQQRPRAGVDCGAGGQNIVDEDHAASLNSVLPVGRDLERALDVAGALRAGQADLLLGRADAPSASDATSTPVCRSMARARAPDWL